VHGTWLGLTRQGRIAVLTNFREEGQAEGTISRGAIVNAFLTAPLDHLTTTEDFAKSLVEKCSRGDVGGFTLIFGQVQDCLPMRRKGLAVISNRTPDVKNTRWIAAEAGETHGLSNSHYGDDTWPKVVQGENLLRNAVQESLRNDENEEHFIARCFEILSLDTLPRRQGENFEVYLRELRNSIFIPPIGGDDVKDKPADEIAAAHEPRMLNSTSGIYGTQKQTVILVNQAGKVTFLERTLIGLDGAPSDKQRTERKFEFSIEGW
jgi:uncharacterized protein with NRDE domain